MTGRSAPAPADRGRIVDRTSDVASEAADRAGEVASEAVDRARSTLGSAGDRSRDVAQEAVGRAQDVAGTVRHEAANVAGEVSDRARALAGEASSQLETQTEEGIRRLAQGVDRLAAKAIALAEGRPREAAPLSDFVWQAAERLTVASDVLHDLADTLDREGWQAAAEEVQSYAQRRPSAFLLGATIAGFGLGRSLRNSSEPDSSPEDARLTNERPGRIGPGGTR
ncbi:MAG: hypothetical protein ACRDZ8_09750 [Acidimicrobiales bacterium]